MGADGPGTGRTGGPGLYVYAVVRAGTPLPRESGGVGSPPAPLRTVGVGSVAAVVSAAPAQLRARRRDLLAHQDLLTRLANSGPVLPMRFGMVASDEDALRAQLAGAETGHLTALDRVAGHIEMNLKALPAHDSLAALVAEDATVRRLREETRRRPGYEANVRLGAAVASALARRAGEAGRRALRELTPMARATAGGPEVPGCALNVSFLVARADSDRFRATADRFAAAHRHHVELRLVGPLPCYSFVDAGNPRPSVPVGGG
ncbi:GvpL/GvpF family gas vesicle protein [Streptomyces sp. NPDC020330]|uniref:GvpL/GvpF family gas vesicle protein n=1 Tax=unclassified Streptomyces TaxID=2593676 RepID=UPI00379B68B3